MGKESMQWDFIVMDDLRVTSCSSTSSLSVLQKLDVPLEDLVEHDLSIVETEIDHEEMISSMKDLNSKIKKLSKIVDYKNEFLHTELYMALQKFSLPKCFSNNQEKLESHILFCSLNSAEVEFPDAAYHQKLGPGEAIAKRDKCE
ncbi:DUF674 family protein [Senna tora]|uniref:DUF674 family protein n=1 Tax=Senna tora TaxID=362788 RepID=A0A834SEM0_9FABA|nr:DUF674 family protein [Senna tora]